jgi:3-oxoacyl-[acyl-carrier protein] reductase
MSNQTRTVIVTGASKGIGAQLAKQLASDGFQTIVNYSASADEAKEVVASIEKAGGRAKAIAADVADALAMRTLFDRAEAEFGPVDVLVNNAGILKNSPLSEVTDEDYKRQIAVNLTGTIGNYLPTYGVYAATKAAVEAMTHILAKELGSRKVTVNAVAPGPVATELFLKGKSDELIQRLTKDIPLGRLGEPDDIALVVSFLASPNSGWINGQVIKVNGGRN